MQSPQYFDSLGPATWLERGAGAVQELFYRWVQPARDGVGAAICVGTNAVYRRAALEAAGGFAQIGHSEDVHTGVALLRNGFGLRYVPVLVARGLCPDGVAGFVSQQYRWCTGSMSLLADRGFHNAGLPMRQRVCFWTGFLYYITTGVNVFAGLASAVVMLWVLPEHVSPLHYLPLVLAVWVMFAQWRRVSWAHYDLNVLRVRMLYSVAHALAVWHALTGRTQEWVPTGAATRGVPLAGRSAGSPPAGSSSPRPGSGPASSAGSSSTARGGSGSAPSSASSARRSSGRSSPSCGPRPAGRCPCRVLCAAGPPAPPAAPWTRRPPSVPPAGAGSRRCPTSSRGRRRSPSPASSGSCSS